MQTVECRGMLTQTLYFINTRFITVTVVGGSLRFSVLWPIRAARPVFVPTYSYFLGRHVHQLDSRLPIINMTGVDVGRHLQSRQYSRLFSSFSHVTNY